MVNAYPVFDMRGGQDIWKQGRWALHDMLWLQFQVKGQGLFFFHKCATAGMFYKNSDTFLLHFSEF
jgi:hypothetical protein